jgi:glycosyltransferase involved in cell wall biosynthesis
VIERFIPRGVKALFIPNGGQTKAAALASSHCAGDWILFLDSDDLVDPAIAREAAAVMEPGWSKIQFQMQVIDSAGAPLPGRVFPKYPANTSPEKIRAWTTRTDCYPTPPNSGNILARDFLDKLYPFEDGMDDFIDSYFISTAPFLGKVLTVRKPLVSYRVHGKNTGANSVLNPVRMRRDLRLHLSRCAYGTRMARLHGVDIPPDRWRYGFYNLAMRVALLRLAAVDHPIAGDSIEHCLGDAMTAVTRQQGLTPMRHVAMMLWLLGVALAPKPVAKAMISWRFVPNTRPRALQRLIGAA